MVYDQRIRIRIARWKTHRESMGKWPMVFHGLSKHSTLLNRHVFTNLEFLEPFQHWSPSLQALEIKPTLCSWDKLT